MVFFGFFIPVLTTPCAHKNIYHTYLVLETVITSIIEVFVVWIPIKDFYILNIEVLNT